MGLLVKGGLAWGVGGSEHVLWIGARLGPDHVVAGVVEVGHGGAAEAGRGEDGLVYCIFLQTSSGWPTRHRRRVAVHGRARLQRKSVRLATINKYTWCNNQQIPTDDEGKRAYINSRIHIHTVAELIKLRPSQIS